MEISLPVDWQGHPLAFHKLHQASENDKCCNSNTDFQCNGTFTMYFGLQQIKLDKVQAHEKSDN